MVVSSVGNYYLRDESKPQTIGLRRYYETMVFEATFEEPYWEADIDREVSFDSPWSVGEAERDSDLAANDMHERVVTEIAKLISGG